MVENLGRSLLIGGAAVLLLITAACARTAGLGAERAAETPFVSTQVPTEVPEPTPLSQTTLHLWAQEAEASSEFASPEWGAEKAVGDPDAPGCGDYPYAWASAASDSVETLTLHYSLPVVPIEILVVESFNPDQVVRVEVYNPETEAYVTVLEKDPEQVDRPCPYQLRVPVEGIDFPTDRVRITVDQSQLGLGWNEIDAVELIGRPPEE
jgi:hypothetical protein